MVWCHLTEISKNFPEKDFKWMPVNVALKPVCLVQHYGDLCILCSLLHPYSITNADLWIVYCWHTVGFMVPLFFSLVNAESLISENRNERCDQSYHREVFHLISVCFKWTCPLEGDSTSGCVIFIVVSFDRWWRSSTQCCCPQNWNLELLWLCVRLIPSSTGSVSSGNGKTTWGKIKSR